MEATYSSETSVDFKCAIRHYIPEDKIFTTTAERTSSPTCDILPGMELGSIAPRANPGQVLSTRSLASSTAAERSKSERALPTLK
jgi:hypothetical protein